jgi:3-dehydroquinate dehydratase/shikimate dehydrogenase
LATQIIRTERLILRTWKDEDIVPHAEMNADPRVREFFTSLRTREESEADIRAVRIKYDRDGFCMFAAELLASGEFIGFIGLQKMNFAIPSIEQPTVEIGWRLAYKYWGKGLATEGARAVLSYGFNKLQLPEIIAITVPANVRSRRVMEKIGMRHFPEFDFDHPQIPEGHPLRRHVLYKIKSESDIR